MWWLDHFSNEYYLFDDVYMDNSYDFETDGNGNILNGWKDIDMTKVITSQKMYYAGYKPLVDEGWKALLNQHQNVWLQSTVPVPGAGDVR